MLGIFIIPTGIGAEIGGHAGDGSPAATLIASCCDKLITHPNVYNASDINEMPENVLYVEGSILDRFLEGYIELQEVRTQNKILVVVNKPVSAETINAVNAARVTIGIDVEILELKAPLEMEVTLDTVASGDVFGWMELSEQVQKYNFDVLAIHTPIKVSAEIALSYFKNGGINPWGGVEAKASKIIADKLNKPVAHAPIEYHGEVPELMSLHKKIVDPRMAPEVISICYLNCILKGLNKAPRIGKGLSFADVDFMISPMGCNGRPHKACQKAKIPIIFVKENKTVLDEGVFKNSIVVENYWEAVGVIMCMKAGIHRSSVRRPLESIRVVSERLKYSVAHE